MTLDEKILTAVLGNTKFNGPIPNFVEKIKQAFADELGMTDLLQDMTNLHANMKQDALRLVLTPRDPKLMTGQEWYDRFEKELYVPQVQSAIGINDDGESHDRFYRNGGSNFMYAKALEAAKRAAGLTKEEA